MQLWERLEDLFTEIPEISDDKKRMYEVLSRRTGESFGADFSSWRKLQPDLPYTEMFARMGLPRAEHVIEVGCGEGDFLPVLSQNFSHVTGIDKDAGHLAQARIVSDKLSKVRLLQADANDLPLCNEIADAVYFRMSLRFFSDREKSLSEALRISKPGARISVIDLPESQSENTESFFRNFCANHKKCQLLHFLRLSPVFICIMQKV